MKICTMEVAYMKSNKNDMCNNEKSEIIIYQTEDVNTKIYV